MEAEEDLYVDDDTEDLAVDHIRPASLGGSSHEGNLQILCKSCNSAKRDRFA